MLPYEYELVSWQAAGGSQRPGDDLTRRVISTEGVYGYSHGLVSGALLGDFDGDHVAALVAAALRTHAVR